MLPKIVKTIWIILLLLIDGCTFFKGIIYFPTINQGNYFTSKDISKIHVGMTKQQIIYILGTPMMIDSFSTNTWYYVSRQQFSYKKVKQQALTLIFNNKGVLTNINHSFFMKNMSKS